MAVATCGPSGEVLGQTEGLPTSLSCLEIMQRSKVAGLTGPGQVTAVEPILRTCSGICVPHGSGSADRETVDRYGRVRVPPVEESYEIRRVWLSRDQERGYYYGFSNEGLWPLCHLAHARPTIRRSDWAAYEAVNRKFADAVWTEALGENPVVLVLLQDYPRFIREKLPRAVMILLRRAHHHEPPAVFIYYYCAADFCYVSSLHDGMNLVAKGFVAARDDEAGARASQFTGAPTELPEALLVNPYDLEEASSAMGKALTMSSDEGRERMHAMRAQLSEFNVYRWAGRMLVDVARIRRHETVGGGIDRDISRLASLPR